MCPTLQKDVQKYLWRKWLLNQSKDQLMNMEEIKLLKDIGVDSIKIEGRMKNESYVFETVSYYKNLTMM